MKLLSAFSFLALICMTSVQAENLYTFDGKSVASESLTPAQQMQVTAVDKQATEKFQMAADIILLENYLEAEVVKQKKGRTEIETKIFEVSEPSEKAVKEWYDANKTKIPAGYEFDKIKPEIVKILKQDAVKLKRDEILGKVKKDGKFALIRGTPEAKVAAAAFYSVNGKTILTTDLTMAQQQDVFEVEILNFETQKRFVDSLLLGTHFAAEAKKKNKTSEEVEKAAFEVKEPSEKELKAWYTKNKEHIPPNYEFDKIKTEITKIIKDEATNAKQAGLLEKIKKEGKFALVATRPVGPTVDVKSDGYPFKGKESAKVTVVEFADYQCPHCKTASEVFKKIAAKFEAKMKFVYVDFPINPSGISKVVAEGSHCASEQNKFWEYHYKAFSDQGALDKDSPTKLAKSIKLDEAKFKTCLEGTKGKAMVEKGRMEGERIGVKGTPYVLINGHRYMGAHTVEAISKELVTYLK